MRLWAYFIIPGRQGVTFLLEKKSNQKQGLRPCTLHCTSAYRPQCGPFRFAGGLDFRGPRERKRAVTRFSLLTFFFPKESKAFRSRRTVENSTIRCSLPKLLCGIKRSHAAQDDRSGLHFVFSQDKANVIFSPLCTNPTFRKPPSKSH